MALARQPKPGLQGTDGMLNSVAMSTAVGDVKGAEADTFHTWRQISLTRR